MEKTLGGDRIGAGKKMKVHLHNYERSTQDLGFLYRTTMAAGTLVPFLCKVAQPADTWDINLGAEVLTHPTIGPLFGSMKVQLDVYIAPMRLYNAQMHNNTLGIGRKMSDVKLPQISYAAINVALDEDTDIDNIQVNPSSLPAYLGMRGIGINTSGAVGTSQSRDFNAIPTLAYWEIYKNYYANKQEEIGAVLHTPSAAITATITTIKGYPTGDTVGITLPQSPAVANIGLNQGDTIAINYTGTAPNTSQIVINTSRGEYTAEQLGGPYTNTGAALTGALNAAVAMHLTLTNWRYADTSDIRQGKPAISTFPLENIDTMRKNILSWWSTAAYQIGAANLEPYKWLIEQPNGIPNILSSQEGLALKTYQSDLFNNWLKTENIEALIDSTAIDTTGGSFTIDQLNLSNKVYKMLMRINVSGGSYNDWLDAVYMNERHRQCESPMYQGGLIKELIFQEVVSNSASNATEGEQPLGTLAGRGKLSGKHKGGSLVIHVDEPSYIIGLVSITPRCDYSQGNEWDIHLKTMDDLHKPALDEIGFQELITEQMAWWDTEWNGSQWVQKSAGKQPAWINYMTSVNKTFGNFAIGGKPETAVGEMFMTLNRRYETDNTAGATPGITDLTTYIDPSKFNYIFAEQQLDAQNYWMQIGVDITARRKMSAKLMPNL